MKVLEKDEVPKILPVKPGRDSKLRLNLLQLEVGQTLFMGKEEWKRKNPPYKVVAKIKKTHGYLFEYGLKSDDTGWLFRRKK